MTVVKPAEAPGRKIPPLLLVSVPVPTLIVPALWIVPLLASEVLPVLKVKPAPTMIVPSLDVKPAPVFSVPADTLSVPLLVKVPGVMVQVPPLPDRMVPSLMMGVT